MHAVLLAAALFAQAASQQTAAAPERAPAPVSGTALQVFEHLPASLQDWTPEGRDGALAMQIFAMVGREDLIARFRPGAFTYAPCLILPGAALDTVIAAAREAQIVIINEAHDQPLHRWTIQQIGAALSGQFEVFAAETFNYVRLMGDREPGALGVYDQEPIFARQIAALDADGYRFAAYEIRAHQRDPEAQTREARIAEREEAQANNLIAAVLEGDPDARILVHVGYSHVLEAPQPRGEGLPPHVWFAARLKEKTGIDPLTVSQTHCAPATVEEAAVDARTADLEEARAAASAAAELRPGDIVLADGSQAAPAGGVDLFLAHAPMTFTDQRPDWRRAAGDVELIVPDALLPTDQPVIIEARPVDAPLAAMPADRVLLYPGEAAPILVPPGEWVLTAWTRDGAQGEPVRLGAP